MCTVSLTNLERELLNGPLMGKILGVVTGM